jgi:hypothetical protein
MQPPGLFSLDGRWPFAIDNDRKMVAPTEVIPDPPRKVQSKLWFEDSEVDCRGNCSKDLYNPHTADVSMVE